MSDRISFIPTVSVDNGTVNLYGHMPIPPASPEHYIGVRITAGSRCTHCGGPFLAGHAVTADLAPNMAGTARHTDCDDPKLEQLGSGDQQ